jgi:hypothetical protein
VDRAARLALFAAGSGLVAALVAQRARASTPADSGGVLEEVAVTARRIASPAMPRGVRLNNPGNIRKGRSNWKGMAAAQLDPSYVTFEESKWGIRALAVLLKNYRASGRKTVRQVIERWAPASENNTAAYIKHVCSILGVKADQELDWPDDLSRLVGAIIKHENGFVPYTTTEINEAVKLA